MELLNQYIEGLNAAIKAGADLQTIINGKPRPVINIEIDMYGRDLKVSYIDGSTPFDQTTHVPVKTQFTLDFTDYPNALRRVGWE